MDKLKGIYGEINGLINGLEESKSSPSDETVVHFNTLVDKTSELLPDEDIERFRITHKSAYTLQGHVKHNWRYIDVVSKMKSLEGFLKYRFELNQNKQKMYNNSTPQVTIINQNTLAVTINQTIQNIIDKSDNNEEKEKLQELNEELNKPDKNWDKVSKILIWILNYSKELSLQILPVILKTFLGGN